MKFRINVLKKAMHKLLKDESGQGTTEYILILLVVVGLAVAFQGPIKELVKGKIGEVASKIGDITPG